jgi:hypothetical protein
VADLPVAPSAGRCETPRLVTAWERSFPTPERRGARLTILVDFSDQRPAYTNRTSTVG